MNGETSEQFQERMWLKAQEQRRFVGLEQAAAVATRQPTARVRTPAPRMRSTSQRVRRSEATGKPRARAENCAGCQRPLRPKKARVADYPGTVKNHKAGRCWSCWNTNPVRGVRQREIPLNCLTCQRPIRQNRVRLEDAPGTIVHGAGGRCKKCSRRVST